MNDRCEQCGGMLTRPGLFGCDEDPHPQPDTAQKIAAAIERDITDRRGFSFDSVDEETQYIIRDTWAELIRPFLITEPTENEHA